MSLKPFTSNFDDESTEAGFQFTFYCDICRDGYKTEFIPSRSYRKQQAKDGVANLVSAAATFLRRHNVSHGVRRMSGYGRRGGMTPEWHKEHEEAFELAQNEGKEHFYRCPRCNKWVCETDWNEVEGLCVQDAPRENVEVASARAARRSQEIQEKAKKTEVFTGAIEGKQTICPRCNKPASEGKFCNNCGADMSLMKCEQCGTESPAGSRFCGECGNRLE